MKSKLLKKLGILGFGSLTAMLSNSLKADDIQVTANITSDTTWVSSNTYTLTDIIYVTDNATLTIEPGTWIMGEPQTPGNFDPGALVITQGAKIMAEGTAEDPIVFTSDEDDGFLTDFDTGLWGGVILLGKATINRPAGTEFIEGLPESALGIYGGTDDMDNSGILKYVSIRHGGAAIADGNEINGLTMGGVGSGTTIEHVEVFANADDGFEFFGGSVEAKWLIGAFNNDDTFDWDEGFHGKGQFWFAIQSETAGDNGAEMDGGPSSAPDATPYATPVIYNATFIGRGNGNGGKLQRFRENTGGTYANSIFTGFDTGVDIREGGSDGAEIPSGEDSRQRVADGDLLLAGNLYYDIGDATDLSGVVSIGDSTFAAEVVAMLNANSNAYGDPMFAGINRSEDGGLNPRPATNGPAYQNNVALPAGDSFFMDVDYKGAFGDMDWAEDWSRLSQGYMDPPLVEVTENITTDTTWSAENTYVLTDIIYVTDNATLTIEPGTWIMGEPQTAGNFDPGALVITQGAKIMAEGTAEDPIVFTSVDDDGLLTELDTGLWGGVILLGKATINRPAGTEYIEGLPESALGIYGGTDDADNSGVLKYVSIRHGGAAIADGNEINGLTMGGVGSGTVIEHVEVFANADDGFEFFGGSVETKWLIGAFNNDDTFDWDEGFHGKGQFWFALQSETAGDNGAEMDGGPSSAPDATPYSTPVIYNATFIGRGNGNGGKLQRFRENTGGTYANSIFTGFDTGVDIREGGSDGAEIPSGEDSRQRVEDGDLLLAGNLYYDIGDATDLEGVVSISDATFKAEVVAMLNANSNAYGDPMLGMISRSMDGDLDARPSLSGPAYENNVALPAGDNFFTTVDYKGAFGSMNWAAGWSKLGDEYTSGDTPQMMEVTENITSDTTWTADKSYILTDIIYVTDGATLTIEPGTWIMGEPQTAGNFDPGALVITQGAKIMAEGTAEDPIVFTSVDDDGLLTELDTGLWGGVILLGKATINRPAGTEYIEGLPESALGIYGGTDDMDNSGVLKYVSIRHGGAAIADGNEINGLTMGGVGSGTTIEHVEVFANADDGFEFFGGAVNTKWLIGAFNNDDTFDWDEGFHGKGQYWFAIQSETAGDNGAEMDGGPSSAPDAEPYSTPVIYNATFIGRGNGNGGKLQRFRENTGGTYANSIFTGFDTGVDIREGGSDGAEIPSGEDSRQRVADGDLLLAGNLYYDIGDATDLEGVVSIGDATFKAEVVAMLNANSNAYGDPMFGMNDNGIDPRPSLSGPAYQNNVATPDGDAFFDSVTHKGAFGSMNWAGSWSKLGDEYLEDLLDESGGTVQVTSNITGDTTWLANNTYVLTDIIYVTDGATLTIEPGTWIMGEPQTAGNFDPGALVITQGAKIMAEGTAEDPIVFTSVDDDGLLTELDTGLWGGVILLGKATINRPAGTEYIEGLPESALGIYGGTDDADNSGVLKYVSIRHGGAAIADGNEINGLTMGGVGSGTVIEHVEVFANADDGFEFFGGAVNTKWLIGAFNNDDTFDWDEGFHGKGQYWFAIQSETAGDNGAEMDGGPSSAPDAQPYSMPVIYNATFIGRGNGNGGKLQRFRENTGGTYANSIFTGFDTGVDIREGGSDGAEIPSGEDSRQRVADGDLLLAGNLYYDIGDATDLEGVVSIGDATFKAEVVAMLNANSNAYGDPMFGMNDDGIDPRPATDGPAYDNNVDLPLDDPFFSYVPFKGAFGGANWAAGWSKLGEEYLQDEYDPDLAPDPVLENVQNPVSITQVGSIAIAAGSEISTYDPASHTVFIVTGGTSLESVDISDPSNPVALTPIELGATAQSVDINDNGLLAVAVSNASSNQENGSVMFFQVDSNGAATLQQTVTVGPLPDCVDYNPAGTLLAVANEGEPSADYTVDPAGSVSFIKISDFSVQTLAFDEGDLKAALAYDILRIDGPGSSEQGAPTGVDIEPEFVAFNKAGDMVFASLQENNAIAVFDIDGSGNASFNKIFSAGVKDWEGLVIDTTDREHNNGADSLQFNGASFQSLNMPDGIASVEINGVSYIVAANEGDGREYEYFDGTDDVISYTDEQRFDDLTPEQQAHFMINGDRMKVTHWDMNGDGQYADDEYYGFGGRSFTIFDADGNLVYDSGDLLDRMAFEAGVYDDGRSDDKGVEPENVAIGELDGKVLAFIGLERVNAIAVFDITDPANSQPLDLLLSNAGLESPEGLVFVEAADSPTDTALLIVANENDNTGLDIYEIGTAQVVAPVITLKGNETVSVVLGEDFVDPGAKAGIFSSNIVVSGTVNTAQEGTYTLSYDVMDGDGNVAETVTRRVVVTAGGDVQVTQNITTDTTWYSANSYILTDIIYVTNGATLTIEPGTTIMGEAQTPGNFDPGALVITQGSKIMAEGTFSKPIVFTSVDDDGALTSADSGLWGGVILLGNATINRPAGTEYIEGLPESNLGIYGGTDDADNSGVLKYVSIRHGGAAIADGNEINGLTMGGVGSGTVIEYVEVFANADDGFEFFGGAVNTKYLIGAYNNDDTFDWDEGFHGKGQFWFAIQSDIAGDNAAEMDGGPSSAPDATPYSTPVIYNATVIGRGSANGGRLFRFRENSGGTYANSIFTGFETGVDIREGGSDGADIPSGEDSRQRVADGDLLLAGNIFHDVAGASDLAGVVSIGDSTFAAEVATMLNDNNNSVANPLLGGISYAADGGLDPRPAEGGPAFSSLSALPAGDGFFENVTHKGAFGYNNWAKGWSFIGQSGAFGNLTTAIHPVLSSAPVISTDWYDHDDLGYVYWNPDSEWLYLTDLGYIYNETGSNWYFSSDSGLGWVYVHPDEVSSETVGGMKLMNGYVYTDLYGYVYISSVSSGDSFITLLYVVDSDKWVFLD